jgi:hypothetical protein
MGRTNAQTSKISVYCKKPMQKQLSKTAKGVQLILRLYYALIVPIVNSVVAVTTMFIVDPNFPYINQHLYSHNTFISHSYNARNIIGNATLFYKTVVWVV